MEKLNLNDCGGAVDDTSLLSIGKGCGQLTELLVSHSEITDTALAQVVVNCRKLILLDLIVCITYFFTSHSSSVLLQYWR